MLRDRVYVLKSALCARMSSFSLADAIDVFAFMLLLLCHYFSIICLMPLTSFSCRYAMRLPAAAITRAAAVDILSDADTVAYVFITLRY